MVVHAIKFVFVLAWLQVVNAMGKEDGFALQCKSVAKSCTGLKQSVIKNGLSPSSGTVYHV